MGLAFQPAGQPRRRWPLASWSAGRRADAAQSIVADLFAAEDAMNQAVPG